MSPSSLNRLLGKKVFSADGCEIGNVGGIARPSNKGHKVSVWIQTGPKIDIGRYVPLDDLILRQSRLTLINHYETWSAGIPMHG